MLCSPDILCSLFAAICIHQHQDAFNVFLLQQDAVDRIHQLCSRACRLSTQPPAPIEGATVLLQHFLEPSGRLTGQKQVRHLLTHQKLAIVIEGLCISWCNFERLAQCGVGEDEEEQLLGCIFSGQLNAERIKGHRQ